jgi:hypothetical protein
MKATYRIRVTKGAMFMALSSLALTAAMAADPPVATAEVAKQEAATPMPTIENKNTQDANSEAVPAAGRSPASSRTTDRLDLDTTVVTGNRELPKVLYIVPWKKADIGDLPAQPFNTLLDEVLTPVDRDVFRREVTYYDALTRGTDATQSTSGDQP